MLPYLEKWYLQVWLIQRSRDYCGLSGWALIQSHVFLWETQKNIKRYTHTHIKSMWRWNRQRFEDGSNSATGQVWWLILYVNRAGPWGAQTFGQTTCWVFLDEIYIWIGGLLKADCPSQCGWTSSNQFKTWIEKRLSGRELLLPGCFSETTTFPAPRGNLYHGPFWVSSLPATAPVTSYPL